MHLILRSLFVTRYDNGISHDSLYFTCPCPACKDMQLSLAPLLLLVATTRAAHWAGKAILTFYLIAHSVFICRIYIVVKRANRALQSVFAGVGLGIGATTMEFTAELDLAGERLTGTGKDKQGTFKLEGNKKNFVIKASNITIILHD